MGQDAHTEQRPRGVVTVDWMVMTVAAIALLFLIGTMIRTSVEVDPTADGGGLRALGADDTLLAFQDFSFDADNWLPSTTSDDLPGLGPVLGPFSDDAVQRSFTMPTTASTAIMSFEVHMIGPWSDDGTLRIALGEVEALTLRAGADGEAPVALELIEQDGIAVRVSHTAVTPRTPDTTLGAVADSFLVVRVQMVVDDPDGSITLRLQAEADDDAQWTLDNLSVVALSGDRGA